MPIRNLGHSVWQTVRGYLLLPHLAPVLFVELATAIFAVISLGGAAPPVLLARICAAILGSQLVIGATNEIVDLPLDAVEKPWKPLPSGAVSLRGAKTMVAVGLALMVAFGLTFGPVSLLLLGLGTGLGVAYDLWFKQTGWSWVPYLLALPLLPIWVFVTLGRPEPWLLLLYPLGGLATIGVHLAQALPDVDSDRRAGLATLTTRLGIGRTFVLAWLFTLSAPLLAWGAARWLTSEKAALVLPFAAGIAVALMVGNVAVMSVDRWRAERACFPLVALSTLVSGTAWIVVVSQ